MNNNKLLRIDRQIGFTLIEISMVLVIASILLTAGLSVGTAQLENARIKNTQEKIATIVDALERFIVKNKRLPCPAVATLSAGNAQYGYAAAKPGQCTSTITIGHGINRNVRGIIPWIELGLSDEAALDAYARRFTYQVLLSRTNVNSVTASQALGAGNIDLLDGAGGKALNPNNKAVAIIISSGKNGFGAYLPITGKRLAVAAAANVLDSRENKDKASALDSRENTDNDTVFVNKAHSISETNPFDDIVVWLDPDDINAQLVERGVIKPTATVVNEGVTRIRHALIASIAADNADPDGGGARTLARRVPLADCSGTPDGTGDKNCLSGAVAWVDLGLTETAVIDPWGRYYQYKVVNATSCNGGISCDITVDGMTLSNPAAGRAQVLIIGQGANVDDSADDITLSLDVSELRGILLNAGVTFNP